MLNDAWQAALPFVRSPARYTDGEWNSYRKPHSEASACVVLVYPDVYEAGVCDYGLALLYEILNEHPDFAADRAYLPWPDMREAMRTRELLLAGIESGRPIADFDLVGISLPSALSFTAIPLLLALAGLPPMEAERASTAPLVLAGGAATVNPEPVAAFFDAILLGEAEEAILDIMAATGQTRGMERAARKEALAALPGVYVPSVHGGSTSLVARRVEYFGEAHIPVRPIVPFVETLSECACVELSRGCACGWRLCPARHLLGDARQRAPGVVGDAAWRALRSTGYEQVTLSRADGCSAEHLAAIVEACLEAIREENASIALPPVRPAMLPALAAHLEGRALDLEVGPASERLRSAFALGPCFEALAAVESAASAGARSIRVHLLIGCPGETDEDVREVAAFINQAASAARRGVSAAHAPRLSAHVSAFIPQPQTPTQWFGVARSDVLQQRIAVLGSLVPQRTVRLHTQQPKTAELHAALSRGDSHVARALAAGLETGLQPMSEATDCPVGAWLGAFQRAGLDAARYSCRNIPFEESLPWQHLRFASSCEDLREIAQGIVLSELDNTCSR